LNESAIQDGARARILPQSVSFDGGMLLVAPPDRLLAYNSTARFIWDRFAAGLPDDDIAATLAWAFGLDAQRASAEVAAIVGHWKSQGVFDGNTTAVDIAPESASLDGICRDWAAVWCCRLDGRVVEMAVQDPQLASFIRNPLRPLEVTATPETRIEVRMRIDGGSTVIRDGRIVRDAVPRAGLKEGVYEALLTWLWPARPIETLIHAGAVAIDEIAWCFPASSGSGKSTLVAHLIGAGYQYLTDDLVALDRDDNVLPLPIPMSLKEGSWPLVGRPFPSLADAPIVEVRDTRARLFSPPGAWDARPVRLAGLVFPRYSAGSPPTLSKLRAAETLVRLREAGAWFGHPLTNERLTRLARWLERTPAYALVYGDTRHAATLLAELPRS
jgi:hypothetical protein